MANGVINTIAKRVEITSLFSFTENYATNTHVYDLPEMRIVLVYYQGEVKAHTADTLLFTAPNKYKPTHNVYVPFVKNNNAYGTIMFLEDGTCKIGMISSTTANGRLYFTFCYLY